MGSQEIPTPQRIIILATSSRLSKGLLAIPRRFRSLFPAETCSITVRFDNRSRTKSVTYKPYDAQTKEARLFGLGKWFSTAGVKNGDYICIIVEDQEKRQYRIASQRLILAEDEAVAWASLEEAESDSVAEQEFRKLARLTRKRAPELAKEEVRRLAEATKCKPRPRATIPISTRSEGVPAGLRLLLRALHDGKCQLCSFTFEKRNGEPYFEMHHLDPKLGHHPHNLLVVCPNCHAQFEHATLTDFVWSGNWLISVTINGKRFPVRQPLASEATRRTMLGMALLLTAHFGSAVLVSSYH